MQSCCHQANLDKVLHLFFASTQLPIVALTPDGVRTCPLLLDMETSSTYPSHRGEVKTEQGLFHVVPIYPCNEPAGVFIIGPYANQIDDASHLSYRPPEVWNHIITLLRRLQTTRVSLPGFKPPCLPVVRAQRIVKKHYDQDISLEGIAKHLGLNRSYLSTVFKEETGQAFTHYVQEVRIEKSKELLRQSSIPIVDIALLVGFSSQSYYTRTFKKLTGITPSEFRKRFITNEQLEQ
ncbi:MAG TPA: helix-turn-helix transcriptional regulator [Firmicutes bacterium]|jgi:AraC-like DNA-binding protein|nr:helix-turn-helix transcriptional regulator [Bacillota bacterium]